MLPIPQDHTTPVDLNQSGIYRITCVPTGKFYIGSAKCFRERWRNHRRELTVGIHVNPHLRNAWKKYGADAFVFEIIELVPDEADLIAREQHWLDTAKPFGRVGFNIHRKAGSPLGITRSPETRAKMSAAQKARVFTEAEIARFKAVNIGRKWSPEHIAKLAEKRRGRKRKPETIEKTAAAHRGSKRSPETCRRIAEKAKGRKQSPETIAKRVEKLKGNQHTKGYKHSPETRARMSASRMGLRPSPETRAKLSEANRRRHAERRAKKQAVEANDQLTLPFLE